MCVYMDDWIIGIILYVGDWLFWYYNICMPNSSPYGHSGEGDIKHAHFYFTFSVSDYAKVRLPGSNKVFIRL
jgi:hypothetical protein